MGFKLGQMLSKANLVEAGLAMGGGAAFGIGYDLLNEIDMTDAAGAKVPIFNTAWKKGLLALGLGVVSGGLLWKKSRPFSHGIIGAAGSELGRMAVVAVRGAIAGAATAGTEIMYPDRVGGVALGQFGQTPMLPSGPIVRSVSRDELALRASVNM